jgi:hypothetical protein
MAESFSMLTASCEIPAFVIGDFCDLPVVMIAFRDLARDPVGVPTDADPAPASQQSAFHAIRMDSQLLFSNDMFGWLLASFVALSASQPFSRMPPVSSTSLFVEFSSLLNYLEGLEKALPVHSLSGFETTLFCLTKPSDRNV